MERSLRFIVFLSLLISLCAHAAGPVPPGFEGRWESKYMESIDSLKMNRVFVIKGNSFSFTRYSYDSANPKDLYLEMVIEGTWSAVKNPIDNHFYNINLSVTKQLITKRKESKNLMGFSSSPCFKINVPVDLIKQGCPGSKEQIKKEQYYLGLLLDEKTLFISSGPKLIQDGERERPAAIQLFPLIKK